MIGPEALYKETDGAEHEQRQAQVTTGAAVDRGRSHVAGNDLNRDIIQPPSQCPGIGRADLGLRGIDIRRDGNGRQPRFGLNAVDPGRVGCDDDNAHPVHHGDLRRFGLA